MFVITYSRCGLKFGRTIVTSGRATVDGTLRYAKKHPEIAFFESNQGFQISKMGVGTYRMGLDDEEHADSLVKSLSSGINCIDTSSNFNDGEAEELTGRIIKHLIRENKIQRDEIVVIGKAGIVQGRSQNAMRDREERGETLNDVDKIDPSLWYCITPEFIEQEITNSLKKLQLDCIDFFLLNNPELYFMTNKRVGGPYDKIFYDRIQKAFEHLEKEVQRGRIQYYGVSSNSLHKLNDQNDSLSLEFLISCANEAKIAVNSQLNHFGLIQFPFNLFEHGAYTNKNYNNNTTSLVHLAKESKITTMTTRPLNAIVENALFRFAYPPKPSDNHGEVVRNAKSILNQTIHLESTYPGRDPIHPLTQSGKIPDTVELSWVHHLVQRPLDYYKFLEIVERKIIPITDNHLTVIKKIEGMGHWAEEYKEMLGKSLCEYKLLLEMVRYFDVKNFEEKLMREFPSLKYPNTLPQKEYQLILNSNIDCVLGGIRTTPYVDDALETLRNKDLILGDQKLNLNNLFRFGDEQAGVFVEKHKKSTETVFQRQEQLQQQQQTQTE